MTALRTVIGHPMTHVDQPPEFGVSPVWMRHAACQHDNPDAFTPNHDPNPAASREPEQYLHEAWHAIAVCERCPVQEDCLRWALESGDEWSVLGGMTPWQRRQLRRELEKGNVR